MPSSTLQDRILELARERELKRGWQASLARHCHVAPASVADWASGKTKTLKGETLLLAADFFRCNPKWLESGRGHKFETGSDTVVAEAPPAPYQAPPAPPAARSGTRTDYRVVIHSLLAAVEQTGQTMSVREFVDRADEIYRNLSRP
jgi:hypothetical protein